ncbi:modulator protein [Novosphingobium sp. PC22D]|uniref:TldD/PmbA family protein n=1 Tax=Novosphingobium sp. PC22D TaxID=1962403 RepID=UPI000BF21DB8|nr:TldD/PmbA family protein [Novosphingobium sp. PC22D]PEQ14218.1 modulator protein [Novosphingobium sp. PC22D]
MLDPDSAADRAVDLVARARRAGADTADAVYLANASQSIQVRLGNLEDAERSESEHIALRVFCGKRSASIGSSDLSGAALDELAARAVDMARAAPEDAYAGLAPEELLTRGALPELELTDPTEPSPQDLRAVALEAEDAGRAVAGVTNSEGAGVSATRSVFALATSHGFARGFASSSHSISAVMVAGDGGAKQRDYAWRQARYREDLIGPAEIGTLAGTRATGKVDPGRMRSGQMPVVLSPRVGGTLIGHFLGAISGNAVARRASFLLDKRGERVFAPDITIFDDPHRVRGLRSRAFDGEGLATSPRALVDQGRLAGWLMDSAAARQLGLEPTGHASRGGGGAPGVAAGNVHISAGEPTPAELMADIAEGVYVTELFGQGVNAVTGDYSRGASGFRIVNGEIAGPVAEFTVAGNLLAMFARLRTASDLEWFRPINVPTMRIDGMTIAGG